MPQRVILAIMGFLAIANAYTMRVCLSVAITQMVKKNNATVNDGSAICPADPDEAHAVAAVSIYSNHNSSNNFTITNRIHWTIWFTEWRWIRLGPSTAGIRALCILHRLCDHTFAGRHFGREIRRQMDIGPGHSVHCIVHIGHTSRRRLRRTICIDCIASVDGSRWGYHIPSSICVAGLLDSNYRKKQNWLIRFWRRSGAFQTHFFFVFFFFTNFNSGNQHCRKHMNTSDIRVNDKNK